jgi:8-oxo-dGTP diphosphatase
MSDLDDVIAALRMDADELRADAPSGGTDPATVRYLEAYRLEVGGLRAEIGRLKAGRETSRPGVCVAVVVEDDRGRVLLLKRGRSRTWPGHWCLPGGRLEPGETLAECCARELSEETGLVAARLAFDAVTEVPGPPHLVGVVFRATGVVGLPANREPDRHDDVGWFSRDAMPDPLMPGLRRWHEGCGIVAAEVERLHRSRARYEMVGKLAASLIHRGYVAHARRLLLSRDPGEAARIEVEVSGRELARGDMQ